MADSMRAETVTLKDGRKVVVRPARLSDAESLLRNVNLIGREGVFILIDEVGPDLDEERQWLGTFDGVRSVLFVADADGEAIGSTDCHGGGVGETPPGGGPGGARPDGGGAGRPRRDLVGGDPDGERARGFWETDPGTGRPTPTGDANSQAVPCSQRSREGDRVLQESVRREGDHPPRDAGRHADARDDQDRRLARDDVGRVPG